MYGHFNNYWSLTYLTKCIFYCFTQCVYFPQVGSNNVNCNKQMMSFFAYKLSVMNLYICNIVAYVVIKLFKNTYRMSTDGHLEWVSLILTLGTRVSLNDFVSRLLKTFFTTRQ